MPEEFRTEIILLAKLFLNLRASVIQTIKKYDIAGLSESRTIESNFNKIDSYLSYIDKEIWSLDNALTQIINKPSLTKKEKDEFKSHLLEIQKLMSSLKKLKT